MEMARCAHHVNALMAQYMGFLFILKILSVESALYELRGRFFIESRIQCLLFLEGSRSSDGVRGETLATKPKRQRICVTLSPRARSRSPIHCAGRNEEPPSGVGCLWRLDTSFVIRSRYDVRVVKAIKPRVHFV